MDPRLLRQLRSWRAEQARLEGVEPYRVLSNATLEALCLASPQTKEDFFLIKGFKEARWQKYGKALLEMFQSSQGITSKAPEDMFREIQEKQKTQERGGEADLEAPTSHLLTVSQFLDGLNVELSGMAARIQGEVSSVDERERVVYFSLKDEKDESLLNCVIFRYQYDISGVKLAVGDQIIAEGYPEIYKPYGKMSFKAGVIEIAGEGALKKAYEALKKKLEEEGIFSEERKRVLPSFPERIALITSKDGAAIGDFTMNLGRLGLKVDFYPTSVEGKKAVFEIIEALRHFNKTPEKYGILVLIRGGGSLESLQAFNNEALVREVRASTIPVLCGIGHEKDVPLVTLACDVAVSTPTATARTLRAPWEEARQVLLHRERHLLTAYERALLESRHRLERFSHTLLAFLEGFAERFRSLRETFFQELPKLEMRLVFLGEKIQALAERLQRSFAQALDETGKAIERCEKNILRYDPRRALALGYSLIQKEGKLLRSVTQVRKGDRVSLRLGDGRLDSEITGVYND